MAATKAKRERWLSTVCKAKETENRALKKIPGGGPTDTLNYHFNTIALH